MGSMRHVPLQNHQLPQSLFGYHQSVARSDIAFKVGYKWILNQGAAYEGRKSALEIPYIPDLVQS